MTSSGLCPTLPIVLRCPVAGCKSSYKGRTRQASLKQHIRRKATGIAKDALHQAHHHPRSRKDKDTQLEMQSARQKRYYARNREERLVKKSMVYYEKQCRKELQDVQRDNLLKSKPVVPEPIEHPEPLFGNPFFTIEEDLEIYAGRSRAQLLVTGKSIENVLRQGISQAIDEDIVPRLQVALSVAESWESDMDLERDIYRFLEYHRLIIGLELHDSFEKRMQKYQSDMEIWELKWDRDVEDQDVKELARVRCRARRPRRS